MGMIRPGGIPGTSPIAAYFGGLGEEPDPGAPIDLSYSVYFAGGPIGGEVVIGNVLDKSVSDAFSISCWIKSEDVAAPFKYLVHKMIAAQTAGWRIDINNNGQLAFLGMEGGNTVIAANTAVGTIIINTWYHVVFTYDGSGSANGLKFYVNGSRVNNSSTSSGTGSDFSSSNSLGIGGCSAGVGLYKGYIDEVGIWNKELSLGEIVQIYNSGTPNNLKLLTSSPYLEAWWRMGDNASGITIPDQVGENDGSLSGNAVIAMDSPP